MKPCKRLLLTALILSTSTLFSQTDWPLGARPQGMGGAYVALSDDAHAVYWNPAGLSQLLRGEASFMHWTFADISQLMVDHLSLAYPVGPGTIGFAWTRLGAELEEGPLTSTNQMSENHFRLCYGVHIISGFSIGTGIYRRLVQSELGDDAGLAFDLSMLWKPIANYDWTFGAVVRDLAGGMKNQTIRPTYAIGTAYQFFSMNDVHHLTMAFDLSTKEDVNKKEGITLKYAGGLEYRLKMNSFSIALRGGISTNTYAYGFGIGISSLCLDYAFVQMKEETIGNSHKFGVSFRFGGERRRRPAKAEQVEKREPVQEQVRSIQLTVRRDGDQITFAWNAVAGCKGYQLVARRPGRKWTVISRRLLTEPQSVVRYDPRFETLEFVVRAMDGKKTIAISNITKMR